VRARIQQGAFRLQLNARILRPAYHQNRRKARRTIVRWYCAGRGGVAIRRSATASSRNRCHHADGHLLHPSHRLSRLPTVTRATRRPPARTEVRGGRERRPRPADMSASPPDKDGKSRCCCSSLENRCGWAASAAQTFPPPGLQPCTRSCSRSSGVLTQNSELVTMSPCLLKLLAGQCQRFLYCVAICADKRGISFQEFLPFFTGHV
jgi:hypothetical protein